MRSAAERQGAEASGEGGGGSADVRRRKEEQGSGLTCGQTEAEKYGVNRRKNTPSKGPFGWRAQCDAVHGEVVFDGENALIPSVRRGAASDLFVLGSRLPYLVHLIEPLTVDRQEHIRLSAYLFDTFRPFRLGGYRPLCASRPQSRTKAQRRQAPRGFAWAEMRPDKKNPAGHTAANGQVA